MPRSSTPPRSSSREEKKRGRGGAGRSAQLTGGARMRVSRLKPVAATLRLGAFIALAAGLGGFPAAAETEIKIGYMKHPVQEASIDVMEKWAKTPALKILRVAMPYEIYLEKVTATLSSGSDQFDIVWHNDDWGQLWK